MKEGKISQVRTRSEFPRCGFVAAYLVPSTPKAITFRNFNKFDDAEILYLLSIKI